MKKATMIFFLALLIPVFAYGGDNPMFGKDKTNSLAIYAAQSTGTGTLLKIIDPLKWNFNPSTFVMLEYSQPMTFFRLPARRNISVAQNFGYNSDQGTSFGAIGISLDVSFFDWNGFYIGLGGGPYMRDRGDRIVKSLLVFGERLFVGKRLSDNWHAEIFTIHFSNGGFTEPNKGFNFTGLSVRYSF